jgi:hypothetical protein
MTFLEWFVDEELCKCKMFFCINALTMITRLIVSKYSFVDGFFCQSFKVHYFGVRN